MSGPEWKLFNPAGLYVAAFKHAEDAAVLLASYGHGAELRWGHRTVVWTEGYEAQPAAESYDLVAATAMRRRDVALEAAAAKRQGWLAQRGTTVRG